MPAPSWPSTAGNTPSGSSPDSVNASVWHSAVWVIFTSTSPFFGPSRSSSTISSGFPASNATAARVFMGGTPAITVCGGAAPCAAMALLEIGTDQTRHLGNAGVAIGLVLGGRAELFADVRLHHLTHQPVDRTTDGCDLLQHRAAVSARVQRPLQPLALAADAADAGQDLLLFLRAMGHGAGR